MELNITYCEDCLITMKRMPDESIDLVVTSPPYDDLRKYNGFIFDYQSVINELYRIIKPGGVAVWVIGDQTKEGTETGTSMKQALYFKDVGFKLNDTMIWYKSNAMPQVSQPRYNQCFEYMFIFSKGKPKTFNPIKIPCKCGGKIYKSTVKNMGGESGRTHKVFNINKEKVANNIWEIAVAQNKLEIKHPAVFPEKLATNHILTWSNEGDVVYDPFMGSGTTAISAIRTNRNFIGSEISEYYCDFINKRCEEELNTKEDSLW